MIGRVDLAASGRLREVAATLTMATLLLVATEVAAATTSGGEYAIYGAGQLTCGAYLESKNNRRENTAIDYQYQQWVMGYITAYNRATPNMHNYIGGADISGAMWWIYDYCKSHPMDLLQEAAFKLLEFSIENGMARRSPAK